MEGFKKKEYLKNKSDKTTADKVESKDKEIHFKTHAGPYISVYI